MREKSKPHEVQICGIPPFAKNAKDGAPGIGKGQVTTRSYLGQS